MKPAYAGLLRLNRKFAATSAIYEYAGLTLENACGNADALAIKNAAFTASYYRRLARLSSRAYRRDLYDSIEERGTDDLRHAVSAGTGFVLISCHLGDFDIAGAWLSEVVGIRPVVVADAVGAVRSRLFDHVRQASGVIVRRPSETTVTVLARDLQAGHPVLVMVDRRSPGQLEPLRFLGRAIEAPRLPLLLAARAGVPLMGGATWRESDGHIVVSAGGRSSIQRGAVDASDVYQDLVDGMSAAVARRPYQFHVPADVGQMSWTSSQSADITESLGWQACDTPPSMGRLVPAAPGPHSRRLTKRPGTRRARKRQTSQLD